MSMTSWKSRLFQIFKHGPDGRGKTSETPDIKSFSAQQEKEVAFDTRDREIQSVPLHQIAGSVGRYQDVDKSFTFKKNMPSERLEWIRKAMREKISIL